MVTRKQSTPNFLNNLDFLTPDAHTYVCISVGKKCLFFRKFGMLYFLATIILRFDLLPYYSHDALLHLLPYYPIFPPPLFKFCPPPPLPPSLLPATLTPTVMLFLLPCFFGWMGDCAKFDVLFYLMILWIYTCRALVP